MQKEDAIKLFNSVCEKMPADRFNVLRNNQAVCEAYTEVQILRIFFHVGKSRLIILDLKTNHPEIFEITDDEFFELKKLWDECAKVKFVIAGWRKKADWIEPEVFSPQDNPYERIYFVQSKSYGEYLFTSDPMQATKFNSPEDAHRILLNLPAGNKVELIEIGVGAN